MSKRQKREGDSREEEERKRLKCDITELEKLPDLYDEIVLTDEEKQHVLETPSLLEFSSDEGSPPHIGDGSLLVKSSQSSSSDSDSDSSTSISVPPTRAAFLKFLRSVLTSKWNLKENARQVFKYFRIRPYIVHPEHFLSKFSKSDFETDRISNILTKLEAVKEEHMGRFGVPWSKLKKSVEELLLIYECEGLEELADIYWDKRQEHRASQLLNDFTTKLKDETNCKIRSRLEIIVKEMTPGGDFEDLFEEYVRILIGFMGGNMSYFQSVTRLPLVFPECKEFKTFTRVVKPDFLLMSAYTRRVVLVGEITVGSHGHRFESHKGRKLKGAYESSDKRDSEKVEPVTSTNIADTIDETYPGTEAETSDKNYSDGEKTLVEDEEPDHADAVTENKEEKDGRKKDEKDGKKIDDTLRYLDKAEKYKVSGFLPQLLAQMMAAMRANPIKTIQPTLSTSENYQLGFAVEGFKLRFVKLVVRDYLERFNDEQPFVNELLKGKPFICDVYMTRELNLLKGSHVKMFFKMLVAIGYNNARILC